MEIIAIAAHKCFVIMFFIVMQPTTDRLRGRMILVFFRGVNAVDAEITARNFVRRTLNHSSNPPTAHSHVSSGRREAICFRHQRCAKSVSSECLQAQHRTTGLTSAAAKYRTAFMTCLYSLSASGTASISVVPSCSRASISFSRSM